MLVRLISEELGFKRRQSTYAVKAIAGFETRASEYDPPRMFGVHWF
jgi:hypothetical protein